MDLWVNFLLEDEVGFNKKDKENIRNSWKDVKKHVELTKMAKYGSK